MNQAALHKLIASENILGKGQKNTTEQFKQRFHTNLTYIKDLFFLLYPEVDKEVFSKKLPAKLESLFMERPHELKKQDLKRLQESNWYQSEKLVGMQLYVDRFSKNLKDLQTKLPYLNDLGVNFLHLMPITTRPAGENDGGYAVNNYHEVDPRYGTKDDFLDFSKKAREMNMFLMLDFVVNHTSDEFEWAQKAKKGEKKYQDFYYTYDDRETPDAFEKTLPEIFPESAPGNFTYVPEMDKWVMTVFNNYQWDLNYRNPEVFLEMLGNLMALANMGVDVIRFDALAFLWKKLGTISQNLPEAHTLISLFRMCLQVIAPGVILLAEAIVAPRDIIKYFGKDQYQGNECEIAYNASLMALLWNSIATKKCSLMLKSLKEIPGKPIDCTWVNYIRCHDDIGLGYDDDFVRAMGWEPFPHKQFILNYFCGRLEWSPARGLMFMYNPKNGDGRITGSAASLLGLETALEQKNQNSITYALDKIIMMHGIILSFGGLPIIYAGDEIATLNDYSFMEDPKHKNDSRWVNRPKQDWKVVEQLDEKDGPATQVYGALKKMISIRKENSVFADRNNIILHETPNPHIFVYERKLEDKSVWVFSNFDEVSQSLDISWLLSIGILTGSSSMDLITEEPLTLNGNKEFYMKPFGHYWITNI
ncbi:alpha-amylase family protein [Maribacter cobaltidurans]|uniref:Alpha amylase n=1 Tax=Maribacter cobaltidurans TaxID=1178778 RepID=A0A223V5S1_9FLAO|nr:alpha-amylase family protein [Maribacter cobaltidurans]ASV30358.1 alpha amylase [Maribacter cobaltidurans]GGD77911.1 alpha-amylase [Maribacter cobaltidurans]